MNKISLLLAASLGLTGCGTTEDQAKIDAKAAAKNIRQMKLVNKTYIILKENVVGVTEENNAEADFLLNGEDGGSYGKIRRSVYYLREGAVITENHVDASNSPTGVNPRPVKQMLDYELEELKTAKQFYDAQMGKSPAPGPYTDTTKQKPVADSSKNNFN